jgi:hypothetical protein
VPHRCSVQRITEGCAPVVGSNRRLDPDFIRAAATRRRLLIPLGPSDCQRSATAPGASSAELSGPGSVKNGLRSSATAGRRLRRCLGARQGRAGRRGALGPDTPLLSAILRVSDACFGGEAWLPDGRVQRWLDRPRWLSGQPLLTAVLQGANVPDKVRREAPAG